MSNLKLRGTECRVNLGNASLRASWRGNLIGKAMRLLRHKAPRNDRVRLLGCNTPRNDRGRAILVFKLKPNRKY